MRTNEFTFKKTKRVKTITEHRGISVDLTEEEAKTLCHLLGGVGGFLGELREKLAAFTGRTRTVKPSDKVYWVGEHGHYKSGPGSSAKEPLSLSKFNDVTVRYFANGKWRYADTGEMVTG